VEERGDAKNVYLNNFIIEHQKETERYLDLIPKEDIALWLLNEGYYPEQNVLPPSYTISNFILKKNAFNSNKSDKLVKVAYPKSNIASRVFSIQNPKYYHNIVFHLYQNWEEIKKILFDKDLRVYSYSFPIPLDTTTKGVVGKLRSGRLIYEWIEMAEKDLITEVYKYNYIIKSDITNFYKSIYTHSIGWAIHGRDQSLRDIKEQKLFGSKIDRCYMLSNELRTNGIPIGSALSDLIAEIILSRIDTQVSLKLKNENVDFIATRFKDDYRFLCMNDDDANLIIKTLRDELEEFNLLINEEKTSVEKLPQGLYRKHDRDYYNYSLKHKKYIPFKTFELTLLRVLDIHQKYRGTSIIEKFLCELINDSYGLKIQFTKKSKEMEYKEIIKTFSLLIMLKRESPKALCHILSIIELVFIKYRKIHKPLKEDIKKIILKEIDKAMQLKSVYELIWYIYFAKYMSLGLDYIYLKEEIKKMMPDDPLLLSVFESKQCFFKDAEGIQLFISPQKSVDRSLAERLSVFNKE
jgi:hypothetical protein